MGVPVFLQPAKPHAAALLRDVGLSNGRLTLSARQHRQQPFPAPLGHRARVHRPAARPRASGRSTAGTCSPAARARSRCPGQAGVRARPQPAGRSHGRRDGAEEPAHDARRRVPRTDSQDTASAPMARSPHLFALALLGGAPATTRAQEPGGDVQAVLDLTLNTASKGEIRVVLAGGEVWADVAALQRAGLVRVAGVRRDRRRPALRAAVLDRPAAASRRRRGRADAHAHGRRVAVWRDDGAPGLGPARRHPLSPRGQRLSELRRDVGHRRRTGAESGKRASRSAARC